jgi:hypothetical protein
MVQLLRGQIRTSDPRAFVLHSLKTAWLHIMYQQTIVETLYLACRQFERSAES